MEIQKLEIDPVVQEYEKTGRDFSTATKPIADYFWGVRVQTLKDGTPKHQPVISPKETAGKEILYVVSSEKFPGWIETSDRYVSDGRGIAIARYTDVSKNGAREDLVRCMKNPNGLFDTHFIQVPDEVLLVSFRTFKFSENREDKKSYNLVPGIGIAEYSKDHIKKWITDEKKPWLDLSNGIANPYTPFSDSLGQKQNNGQNIIRDAETVTLQDFSWPVVLYHPNIDGKDQHSWNVISKTFGLKSDLPKSVTWHTSEIKKITEKWLKPFVGGVREVSQDQL